jgi:K+-sensing histidine kinase KdpD
MIVPIWRQGRTLGAISFMSTDSSRRYTTDDLAMVEELATRTAIAIENARLYAAQRRARADAERAAKRAALLAEAGALLAASLDYEETLNQLAHFMVSRFGDLCVVFLSGGDGAIWRVAAAHIDPVREDALRALQVHPIEPDSAHPAAVVIRTGKSTFNPSLTGAIEALAQNNPDAIERARTLIPTSHLIVPLIARRRVIGALSFGTISAENSYDIADLLVAEELGNRAALAIDNSRLYHDMQQAVRTRDVFLSIASHELKTPLTALFGQAQLLQRRIMHAPESSERDHRAIRVIVEQAQRLNKLIMTLLDVSRLSQGQLGLERVPIDLGILVQRVSEDFEPELEQHRLVFEPYHEPLIVTGDWLRLEQVMQNLLQNAVKYSPKGGRIVIRLDRRGTRVLLSVADEGIGIPQTEITRLFERFYRVETDAAQHVSGIGVGLYIVKEIVTAHDGEVHVTSTEGVGSTFTVSLPHASV